MLTAMGKHPLRGGPEIMELERFWHPKMSWYGPARDLSDARDVAAAYVLSLERGEAGAVYNVCSGRSLSVREALDIMMELSGVSAEVVVQADRLRPHDLETLKGSSHALRTRTGWAPRVPLETTFRDLLAYWEARSALPRGR